MSETEQPALALAYDSGARTLTITTPGGNRIVVADADGSVAVADQYGNRARLDATGISLESAGNLSIHAVGDISLSAGGSIALAAQNEVKADGQVLKLAAKTSLSAIGAATAELSSSGQTVVRGALVSIN